MQVVKDKQQRGVHQEVMIYKETSSLAIKFADRFPTWMV